MGHVEKVQTLPPQRKRKLSLFTKRVFLSSEGNQVGFRRDLGQPVLTARSYQQGQLDIRLRCQPMQQMPNIGSDPKVGHLARVKTESNHHVAIVGNFLADAGLNIDAFTILVAA